MGRTMTGEIPPPSRHTAARMCGGTRRTRHTRWRISVQVSSSCLVLLNGRQRHVSLLREFALDKARLLSPGAQLLNERGTERGRQRARFFRAHGWNPIPPSCGACLNSRSGPPGKAAGNGQPLRATERPCRVSHSVRGPCMSLSTYV